jgi:predicted nucleotidyltransferase component of viral defense system
MVILKGGMLIASMVGINSRTTMDMDATLRGYPLTEKAIQDALSEICAIPLGDEVTLEVDHITPIREDDEYGGFRVAIIARYESINTPLKIDITTGDIITPGAIRYAFHSNYENKKIEVWAYNVETILAEKVETILRRSVLNTRPRDFYDVYIIMKTQRNAINKEIFTTALNATSKKRMSFAALKDQNKILLTIQADPTMRQRWERYCKDNYYANGVEFDEVIGILTEITYKGIVV